MSNYPREAYVFHNGKFEKATDINLSSIGAVLHLAGAAFEGIRAYNTHNGARLFKAEEHFERLRASCVALGIDFSHDISELIDITYRLLKKNKMRSAYVRPFVYSNPDLNFFNDQPSIIISSWEWGPFFGHQPLNVTVLEETWASANQGMASVKFTGQYTRSLLALRQARKLGFDDAVLTDAEGWIQQGSASNIFIEKDGEFFTPGTQEAFPGITRKTVFEICKSLGIGVSERQISREELMKADSAFLCGTAAEIIGIKSVDNRALGEHWPHTLGATIQRTYKNLVLEQENFEVII